MDETPRPVCRPASRRRGACAAPAQGPEARARPRPDRRRRASRWPPPRGIAAVSMSRVAARARLVRDVALPLRRGQGRAARADGRRGLRRSRSRRRRRARAGAPGMTRWAVDLPRRRCAGTPGSLQRADQRPARDAQPDRLAGGRPARARRHRPGRGREAVGDPARERLRAQRGDAVGGPRRRRRADHADLGPADRRADRPGALPRASRRARRRASSTRTTTPTTSSPSGSSAYWTGSRPWSGGAARPGSVDRMAEIALRINGEDHRARGRCPDHAARPAARAPRADRREEGLRPRPVRRLHDPARRPPRQRLPRARRGARRRRAHHGRRARRGRRPASAPGRRSSSTTRSSAATAPLASSARRSGCSPRRTAERASPRLEPTPTPPRSASA